MYSASNRHKRGDVDIFMPEMHKIGIIVFVV